MVIELVYQQAHREEAVEGTRNTVSVGTISLDYAKMAMFFICFNCLRLQVWLSLAFASRQHRVSLYAAFWKFSGEQSEHSRI
eukprot:5764509-Amphidinium_carterae.1